MFLQLYFIVAAICALGFGGSFVVYALAKESLAALFSWVCLVALAFYTVVALVVLR